MTTIIITGKFLLVSMCVTHLFITDVRSQHSPSDCGLYTCFPKLTSNTSNLHALLVFGIFETSLEDKCETFAKADGCFEKALDSCPIAPSNLKRRFLLKSWHNAKKLLDYVCKEEYEAFHKNQHCMRSHIMTSGVNVCDKLLLARSSSDDVCRLGHRIRACVDPIAKRACPEAMTPKILKMVRLFMEEVINLKSPNCSNDLRPIGSALDSIYPEDENNNVSKEKSEGGKDEGSNDEGTRHQHPHHHIHQRHDTTTRSVANFYYTKRRYGALFTTTSHDYTVSGSDDDGDDHHDDERTPDAGQTQRRQEQQQPTQPYHRPPPRHHHHQRHHHPEQREHHYHYHGERQEKELKSDDDDDDEYDDDRHHGDYYDDDAEENVEGDRRRHGLTVSGVTTSSNATMASVLLCLASAYLFNNNY